ncbi:GerAB/ArcD/ProY family transporter [Candidatus Formimonas warabiya]|uniref:GerAB/ArcD/ProY family transporter n=1 Tax=Formimonas warabiya TaxID=1761012 RepID=UPI001BE4A71C|nr:endospore germination permease [Candidatus Formimonas warabiya]
MSKNDRLDPKVLTVLLIVGVIEFELFTFAKGVIEIAKQDAWISVLLGGAFALVITCLMVKLGSRFPKENFFQYSRVVWGKPTALILIFLFILYWFVYLVLLHKETSMANEFFFLKNTPPLVPIALFAIIAAWLVLYGLTAVIRFFQITIWFMILPLLFISLVVFTEIDFKNFLPILPEGFLPVLKGAINYAGVLQGLEIILFALPFLTDAQKALKPALLGTGVVIFFSFVQVFSAIGILGVPHALEAVYPGYEVITRVELPGMYAERLEFFLTLPWIVGVFTTICLFTYLVFYGVCQLFSLRNKKTVVFAGTAFVIVGTTLFPNFAWQIKVRETLNYATLVFTYLIPILTYFVAIVGNRRDSHE